MITALRTRSVRAGLAVIISTTLTISLASTASAEITSPPKPASSDAPAPVTTGGDQPVIIVPPSEEVTPGVDAGFGYKDDGPDGPANPPPTPKAEIPNDAPPVDCLVANICPEDRQSIDIGGMPPMPRCGGSKAAWDYCMYALAGVSYKRFANTNRGRTFNPGDAYSPRQLPLMALVYYEGFWDSCEKTRKIPALLDENGVEIEPARDEKYMDQCWVEPKTVEIKASPAVSLSTPDRTAGDKVVTCNQPYVMADAVTGEPIIDDNGDLFSMPYSGYAVAWQLINGKLIDDLGSYQCIRPAKATVKSETCYLNMKGKMRIFMPDGQFSPKPGPFTASMRGITPSYTLERVTTRTDYSRQIGSDQALETCRQERLKTWRYDELIQAWGWGHYDTELFADYDELKVIRFVNADAFLNKPPDIVLWNQSSMFADNPSQVATWDNPASADASRIWRTEIDMFCSERIGNVANTGKTMLQYRYGQPYAWENGIASPAGLTYTGDDCTGDEPPCADGDCIATNRGQASWFCANPFIETWAGVEVANGDVQSQADGKARTAVWGDIQPTNAPGKNAIRNVTDQTMTYIADDDSSPVLARERLGKPNPGINNLSPTQMIDEEPFEFFVKDNAGGFIPMPPGTTITNDWPSSNAWSLDNRSLVTRFFEASRTDKDFSIHPLYTFNAEFKTEIVTSLGLNQSNGNTQTSTATVWMPSNSTCEGETLTMDVLRVGSVPN